ncbi:MAG: hypothetical protein H6Q17_272, partial [Bacteroidetes bacterium]|nr:hypothetical protein [Bacteroidota bacterium]
FDTYSSVSSGTLETVAASANNATRMIITNGGNVGIGTTSPSNILSLGGTAARTIWMERNATANTAGQGLTLSSGGAKSGGTDLSGGDLTLQSGISTGTGTSAIHFYTAKAAAATGTVDNAPSEKVTILGSGNVGIGNTSPTNLLDIAAGTAARSGTHATGAPLYVTGDISEYSSGIEFRHYNGTQGIGIGYAGIYAAGSNTNQNISFVPKGTGSLNVLGKLVIQNTQNGGSGRGIYMWSGDDSNWGIYMGQPGANRSLGNGTAVAGAGFTSHAIRIRTGSDGGQGIIFENKDEALNFSMRGSDGLAYFRGNVGIGTTSPAAKLDVKGQINITQASGSNYVGLVAPTTLANYTLTLPAATPTTDGQVLASTTDGTLSWKAANTSPIELLQTNNLVATGQGAANGGGSNSIVLGSNAGGGVGLDNAIVLGTDAGFNLGEGIGTICIGSGAGKNRNAINKSVFIGWDAGKGRDANPQSVAGEHSIMIGPCVGKESDLGNDNIVIGNCVTLPDGSSNRMNLGGVLFGTGLYAGDFSNTDSPTPSASPADNGKIGIGTNAPAYTLDVNGIANVADKLYVTNNVGIGTTSPAAKLDVVGDVSAKRYLTTMPAAITTAATTTVDLSAGNVFTLNVGASISTLNLNNAPTQPATFVFKLSYSSSTAYTISWPTAFLWSGGTPPILTCVSGKTDILSIIFDGTKYYCSYALNF